MSELRANIRRDIEAQWGDQYHTTDDGQLFYAPPVRQDGTTSKLIDIAVEVAQAYADKAYDEGVAAGAQFVPLED